MTGLLKPPASVPAPALALGSEALLPFLLPAAAFSAPAFWLPALAALLSLVLTPSALLLPLPLFLPAWRTALLLPFSPPSAPAFLTEALLLLAALAFALSPCVISVLRAVIVAGPNSLSQCGLRWRHHLTHRLRK